MLQPVVGVLCFGRSIVWMAQAKIFCSCKVRQLYFFWIIKALAPIIILLFCNRLLDRRVSHSLFKILQHHFCPPFRLLLVRFDISIFQIKCFAVETISFKCKFPVFRLAFEEALPSSVMIIFCVCLSLFSEWADGTQQLKVIMQLQSHLIF